MALITDAAHASYTGSLYGVNCTSRQFLYRFEALLLTAGCTVVSSGDGLALYSSSGDVITGDGTGAGGRANAKAWRRIKLWNDADEIMLHAVNNWTSSDVQIRGKYALGPFSGGSPNATTTPTASSEAVFWGAGTDAAPTSGSVAFQLNSDNNFRVYACASNDPADPYFHVFSWTNSTTANKNLISYDQLVGQLPGATHARALMVLGPNVTDFVTSTQLGNESTSASTPGVWSGIAGTIVKVPGWWLSNGNRSQMTTWGASSITSKEGATDVTLIRPNVLTAPFGWQGRSKRWHIQTSGRADADTLDVASAGAKDWMLAGNLWLPNKAGQIPVK